MRTYAILALLLCLNVGFMYAQNADELAYHQKFKSATEAGSEQIQVKAYPNPFHEQIQFQFDITETSQVNLTVFDITGKQVAVLVNGLLPKDSYKLGWKPVQQLSSMYIYVFSAGKNRKTGKILFIHKHL